MSELFDLSNFDEYKEDNCREVKKAEGGLPIALWESYSSFANSNGGVIILGVGERQDGKWYTTGLKNANKLKKNFWNTIHDKKIFEDSELQEDSVIRKFRITALDGKGYNTNHYSLEMIIAVGFKVNSERAVQFRKWVNQIAKDYTIKGWVMDDERLKCGTYLTEKYFDEQLERIREIRASERKFYQKITDIYATAIDYDKNSATTRRFYATVQNKMHYAVHGHTAAELIVERANHTKENMGLTTWADALEGKIKKSDVTVARNYLTQNEMKQLNRMVTAYLDFAENMTLRHIPLTMQDWEKRLNSFIEMFDYGILQDAGKITAEIAKLHAETEFEKYRIIQDRLFMSDFDKYMLELEKNAKK